MKSLDEKIEDFFLGNETYSAYGPYTRKEDNRKHVVIVHKQGGLETSRQTVSWPKMLVSLNTGIPLSEIDTVEYVDKDVTNDNISNLRITDRATLTASSALHIKVDSINCPVCGKPFTPTRDQRNSRAKAGPFCSKSCAGKYSSSVQNGKPAIDKTSLNKTYYKIENK